MVLRLCVLLRLAVVLHRSRSSVPLPAIGLRVHRRQIELRFPPAWLEEHPLTRADLQSEARLLRKRSFALRLGSPDSKLTPATSDTPDTPDAP